MKDHRDDNTATVITGSGTSLDWQVLIEGGFFGGQAESTAEIYDPAMQKFTSTGTMNFGAPGGIRRADSVGVRRVLKNAAWAWSA